MSDLFTRHRDAGLSAFPLRCDGSKAPAVSTWKPFSKELPTAEQAAEWDRTHRAAAIACGAVSGNLEIIDVDEPSLSRPFLETVQTEAPDLFHRLTIHRTPRRNQSGQAGCHILYRCPGATIGGNAKLAMSEPEPELGDDGKPVLDSAGKPRMSQRTLIETRGTGGYCVVVGSHPSVHSSGRPYEHAAGPDLLRVNEISPDERDLLWKIAGMFDRSVAASHRDPQPPGYLGSDARPGDEFAARTSWGDLLEPAGWTRVGESAGITRWRRPGKSQGWSATTGILSDRGQELLCVFSSNAHPFPGPSAGRACSTHGKFDAFALLHHGGNHREAARALADRGFGSPPRKQEREQRLVEARTLEGLERQLLQQLATQPTRVRSTGLASLDDALAGGYEPGEVVLLGGPTSHGKTVLGMQFARNEADSQRNVIIVSEEMAGLTLAQRSLQTRIDLPTNQWGAVADQLQHDADDYWRNRGTVFVLESCRTMKTIQKAVEQIVSEFEVHMLVLDYCQLIRGDGNSRYEAVTDTSSRFAELTRKNNMVGVLLAQLNRDSAKNGVSIHAFKDSSQLEQDADIVLLVEWLAKSNPQHPSPRDYKVRVEKNRNRGVRASEVLLEFYPEFQEIREQAGSDFYELNRWNEGGDRDS